MKCKNLAGEHFKTNMCHHPPMVFAPVYQAEQKLEFSTSSALLLEEKTVVGAGPFYSKSYSLPGGLHTLHIHSTLPQSWRVSLSCFQQRTAVLSISLLESDSQFVLFYTQTLCFLFCTAKSCQLNTREFTLPLYKQF